MKRIVLLTAFAACMSLLNAQDLPAYQIFNHKGQKVSYNKMIKGLAKADVVMFGELHNNPIAHWLQYETTEALLKKRQLILGAEMFETDNQDVLTKFVEGNIDAKQLDTLARLWPNYSTDYRPLVEIAKNNQIPFIATNIPRRYASMVYRGSFEALDTLPEHEKQWFAPLPIQYDSTVACYQNILKMSHGHGGANLPKAQAVKDATMAYNILQHYKEGLLFLHFQGNYHSDNHEGILWYLHTNNPELIYLNITVKTQEDLSKLDEEYLGTADYIIVVDQDMTTTY